MNSHDPKRLSRRQLLRIMGASGLAATVASANVAAPNTVTAQTDTPEAFLAHAYAQRAQAMTTRALKALEQLYDTANPQLLAFEKDRAAFMNDLGSRWNGTLLGYTATVSLIDLKQAGSIVNMRVYEQVRVNWIPTPRPVSAVGMELRRQYPEKFAATSPTGSRGEITSGLGNRHEIVLEKSSSGWRLVHDSYEEPDLYGVSPDLVPETWLRRPGRLRRSPMWRRGYYIRRPGETLGGLSRCPQPDRSPGSQR